jgi:outer membrane cobalamin receptor
MANASRQLGPLPAALVILVLASTAACTGIRATESERGIMAEAAPEGQIITREDIVRTRATNALEAIERGGTHLLFQRSSPGQPIRISHRGADSIVLGNQVLVVVDGNRVNYPERMLRNIPAGSIVYIQVLSGRQASTRWGSEAANGVIVVRTSAR